MTAPEACRCHETIDDTCPVVDSRPAHGSRRRRRQCRLCGRRFTTYEIELGEQVDVRIYLDHNGPQVLPLKTKVITLCVIDDPAQTLALNSKNDDDEE